MLVSYTKPHNCKVSEWGLEPWSPDPSLLKEFLGLVSKTKAPCKLTPWSMPVRLRAFLDNVMWPALFTRNAQEWRALSENTIYKIRPDIKKPRMPFSASAQHGYCCPMLPHSGQENSRLSLSLLKMWRFVWVYVWKKQQIRFPLFLLFSRVIQ